MKRLRKNNLRKISLLFILICIMTFGACGKSDIEKNLEFPKTTWEMTLEEVMEAYGISKDEAALYEEGERSVRIRLDDVELFGQKAQYIFLSFADFSCKEDFEKNQEKYILYGVHVLYNENSDMDIVKKELEKAYGDTIPEYYHFTLLKQDQMRQDAYKESDSVKFWGSSFLKDIIPAEQSDEYRDYWKFYQGGLTDDNWDFFKDNSRMVVVTLSDNEGELGKSVSWNAMNYAIYHAYK